MPHLETINLGPMTRRAVLRGAGALVALPFLESLARPLAALADTSVAAAATPPLRMGIWTVTGGTVIESFRHQESGPLNKLPSILRPLESVKQDMLLLGGLSHSGQGENVNGHEHCAFLHLTAAERVNKVNGQVHAGKSVDQAAAEVVGRDTYLPSLEIGLSNQETKYSFRSADSPVPYEANPRLVFERMFRGRKPIVPNWSRRASAAQQNVRSSGKDDSYQQSVMDLVLGEAADLRRDLGNNDKRKLDEYLASVRDIEKRIQTMEAVLKIEAADAANPGPSSISIPESARRADGWKGDYQGRVHRDPELHGQYIRAMADLLVLAFQTDTTRVATLACGSDEALFPGIVTVGYERHCHTLEHQGNAGNVQDADPISREACRQIHAWYTSLFAEMVVKMKSIDEGHGTLLDNTMLLYTSYMADGGHGKSDYPAVLVGNARGTLKTGREIAFKKDTPMANLFVEMLDRMGNPVDTFGDSKTSPNSAYGGRLPGLV